MKRFTKSAGLFGVIVGLGVTDHAMGLEVTPESGADVLASLLFPGTDGLIYTNGSATLLGHTKGFIVEFDEFDEFVEKEVDAFSSGTFTNVSGTYGIGNGSGTGAEGVILSTGEVRNYGDLNSLFFEFAQFNVPADDAQNALLNPISGQANHNDVTELIIPFNNTTGTDQPLTLSVVFGTQEYPQFVNSEFNDGFGAYLNGTNVAQFRGLPMNVDHPNMAPFFGTTLTGLISDLDNNTFDPRLNLIGMAQPGENELTLIIGDATDTRVDTTVYLSRDTIPGPVPDQPRLPDEITDDGGYVFILPDTPDDEFIFIDPDVAVGYTYVAIGSEATPDPKFDGVIVPPVGFGTFLISFGSVVDEPIFANEEFDITAFEPDGVSAFTITGIDPSAMLDPLDPLVFLTGVSFTTDVEGVTVIQTPITEFIPEPGTAGVLLLGMLTTMTRLRRDESVR